MAAPVESRSDRRRNSRAGWDGGVGICRRARWAADEVEFVDRCEQLGVDDSYERPGGRRADRDCGVAGVDERKEGHAVRTGAESQRSARPNRRHDKPNDRFEPDAYRRRDSCPSPNDGVDDFQVSRYQRSRSLRPISTRSHCCVEVGDRALRSLAARAMRPIMPPSSRTRSAVALKKASARQVLDRAVEPHSPPDGDYAVAGFDRRNVGRRRGHLEPQPVPPCSP